jgi:mannosyltransferase OCH1-like enzyme
MNNKQINIFIAIIIMILIIILRCNNKKVESFTSSLPYLWLYWENINNDKMPGYITLCIETIYKHCSKSFNIILLNEKSINNYLPELNCRKFNLDLLNIQQKVDYYRLLLLKNYGGLYMDVDIIVLRNPIEILKKLKKHDYVGFGCTGHECLDGYLKPSNWVMCSRKNGILINNTVKNIENKLLNIQSNIKYHEFGKLILWEELNKLNKQNYTYYHYKSNIDGTRDMYNKWVTTDILFSTKPIKYELSLHDMLFIVMYNSEAGQFKKLSKNQILNSNTNFSKFIKYSLDI